MTIDFELYDDVAPNDKTWAQWRATVESEGWTTDDHSVMAMIPSSHTTRTVVAKDRAGNFLGSVVWNEYDDLAFIGFYLLHKDHRGKGIGSLIWRRAMKRIPGHLTIALHSVPNMVARYQSWNTPVVGPKLYQTVMPWKTLYNICLNHGRSEAKVKSMDMLNAVEMSKYLQFDKKVTGKDRSSFLKKYFALPFTAGNVFFNSSGQVAACASITSTSVENSHLYKLSPIYANSLPDALAVAKDLVSTVAENDPKARLLVTAIAGTRGEKELLPLLASYNVDIRLTSVTLSSKELKFPTDMSMVYILQNHPVYIDA